MSHTTDASAIDDPAMARDKSRGDAKTASLYRMAMPGHLCPFGLKSKSLLRRKGFEIDDNLLTTRDEVDAFRAAHDVKTTPQTFIDGERIGGYTDLKQHFGLKVLGKDETTYRPIVAIFGATFLMALAITANFVDGFPLDTLLKVFFATSMVALAIQKLHMIHSVIRYDISTLLIYCKRILNFFAVQHCEQYFTCFGI